MQLGMTVAARLEVSGDKHVEVPALDCVLAPLQVTAALRFVAWAKDTFTVRGHFLVSNALCQARPAQCWSGLDLP